ncbi:MAG: ABC transporter substrate-binding protein [Clostridia bacterium]|nr:ABC transporter substrate-binding protein [Clostridia bacterium]
MKKFIAILLAAALLFSATACSDNNGPDDENESTSPISSQNEGILNLAYSEIDTLNPFTCTTAANLQLLHLVYDGLYTLDKSYTPVATLAESGEIGDKTVTVKLGSHKFGDGTPVSVTDVKASFEKAKESPAYKNRLSNFESVGIYEGNLIIFNLVADDPYALACLDFPIIKGGADTDLAAGCGRYIPRFSGDEIYLTANASKKGFVPAIKNIKLIPVRDEDAIISNLEIGNTCFNYNDLNDGSYSRINAKTVEMGINNFVYLAFNNSSAIFSNKLVRRAVNLAVNRQEIVSTAFQGHARIAYTPFNPDWYVISSKDTTVQQNKTEAAKLIEQSQIDVLSQEIVLLVNSDNRFKLETAEFIKGYLEALGFRVNVRKLGSDSIRTALNEGNYDLYIGEIKLTPNMDLSPILLGGNASYGISNVSDSSSRYAQFISGNCEIMDFINTFNEDLPLIPLCYRNAAVSYTNSMQADFACCDGDVYADIQSWKFK